MIAPQSPPAAAKRSWPSRRISSTHSSAIRCGWTPVVRSGVLNPYPGSDGTISSKEPRSSSITRA